MWQSLFVEGHVECIPEPDFFCRLWPKLRVSFYWQRVTSWNFPQIICISGTRKNFTHSYIFDTLADIWSSWLWWLHYIMYLLSWCNRFNTASMQMTANCVPLHGDETLNWVTDNLFESVNMMSCHYQWLLGLRHGSESARLLGLLVRIPLRQWSLCLLSVECCQENGFGGLGVACWPLVPNNNKKFMVHM